MTVARPVTRMTSAPTLWLFIFLVTGIWLLTPHQTGIRPTEWLDRYRARQETLLARPMESANITTKRPLSSAASSTHSSKLHPIQRLHEEALQKWQAQLERQSSTLDAAIKEYKRRYQRNPPPGFNKWFQFAQDQGSFIIDDFDMIDEAMAPFWKLEPRLIKQISERAGDGAELWTLSIHNGHAISSEENWMGERIGSTLQAVIKDVPNLDLLMNPLDEPRVLLSKISETDHIRWVDESQRSSWDSVVGPCKWRSPAQRAPRSSSIDTLGLPFITDRVGAMDVCQNPAFQNNHGFFIAPYSLITTTSPVPILSQAAPSTFSDILYPSMWYWDNVIPELEEIDPEWSDKKNRVYWAGSTTGGYNRGRHRSEIPWRSHRHRFVELTKQLLPGAVYSFLTQGKNTEDGAAGAWRRYESEEIMSNLYDTKFTKVVQCEEAACEADFSYYKVAKPENGLTPYKSRFVMDMDGNSFSGRFYNFLASKSCPLKQTIFREWHDERLMPWVHYVPVSTGMEELPETVRYLATTEEGTTIAKAIAAEGTKGYKKMLRNEDAAIYLYRLFLELARVMSDDRDERRL